MTSPQAILCNNYLGLCAASSQVSGWLVPCTDCPIGSVAFCIASHVFGVATNQLLCPKIADILIPIILYLTHLIIINLQPSFDGVDLHCHQKKSPQANQNSKHRNDVLSDRNSAGKHRNTSFSLNAKRSKCFDWTATKSRNMLMCKRHTGSHNDQVQFPDDSTARTSNANA